jgi:hypothetical protein
MLALCTQYEVQLDMLRQREVSRYGESCPPLPVDMDDVSGFGPYTKVI